MSLQKELKLKRPFASANHEALLSIVRTAGLMQKLSDRFFSQFGLTDAQFNILMILEDYGADGISQQELSEKLVVTKSNIVGLVDRLEKAEMVRRKPHPVDRRFNQVVLTAKGLGLLTRVEQRYFEEVDRMMGVLTDAQKRAVIVTMDKIREYINSNR